MSDPCAIIPTIFDPWEANMEPRRFLLPLELNPKRRAWLPHGSSYIRHLPHWRFEGATYFLTWRLHPLQHALKSEESQVVFEALKHFDAVRYTLLAGVVMDDHVHAMVAGLRLSLERVVHSWKSFTSHALVRGGRAAPVWQREYFDRVVRGEFDLEEKTRYIAGNPSRRWPEIREYAWVYVRGWGG
jgi:REP element-mobilizing transposase RayT